MNRICNALVAALVLLQMTAVQAHEPRTPRQMIEHLGVQIRQNLEDAKATQTPEVLERAVAEQITALIGSAPGHLSLTAPGRNGRTPLMQAASDGYPLVVRALLADASVKLRINEPDKDGATAWMLASFAPPLTLVACEPGTLTLERYPLLPPYQRRMAHLLKDKGAAIFGIPGMLEEAGASADAEAAKRAWLARCPNATPELREALAKGDLRQTLVHDAITRLQEFDKLTHEAPSHIPARPPRDMVFVRYKQASNAQPRSPLLQLSQVNCARMDKPKVPSEPIWEGRVLLGVMARTRAGVVEAADVKVVGEQPPRAVADQLRAMTLRALATYQCEGDALFSQEFEYLLRY